MEAYNNLIKYAGLQSRHTYLATASPFMRPTEAVSSVFNEWRIFNDIFNESRVLSLTNYLFFQAMKNEKLW